jgi:hypothetical protein
MASCTECGPKEQDIAVSTQRGPVLFRVAASVYLVPASEIWFSIRTLFQPEPRKRTRPDNRQVVHGDET